ncbi:MAG: NERD domain-containing protein [Bacilli bacterium]|nr:NERD domain-containing protein [Bacilli bacterium]
MILLNVAQTLYISLGSIGVLVVLFLLCFLYYRNVYVRKHARELTYLKLSRICEHNDYLLLNDYHIDFDDSNKGLIDHLVISNKYIIIISVFSISGVLSGKFQSEELVNVNKKGTSIVANPINYNINLTKRLSLFNDLNHSFLKGLVVINNDSDIKIEGHNEQFQIIKRKDLGKTIKEFDQENIKNLNEESIIRFINKLNEENK